MNKNSTPHSADNQCCANCQCCSPSGAYCYLWMVATSLSYGCNQWTKARPVAATRTR